MQKKFNAAKRAGAKCVGKETDTLTVVLNLKGNSTQNENFVINLLPPCRSKPVKALFVFGTQFKIFWMKAGRLVIVPLTAKQLTLSRPRKV